MAGEPWTQKDVAAFLKCSLRTVRRLNPPRIPIAVRGDVAPLLRYDSDEVRAWWGELVSTAQQLRTSGTGVDAAKAQARAMHKAIAEAVETQRTQRRPRARAVMLECVNPADVRKAG